MKHYGNKFVTMKNLIFMKFLSIISAAFFFAFTPAKIQSAHSFKIKAIDGGTIDLAAYKGKKILVVNTASQCGYTRQYSGLEELYKKYRNKLVVIGFPANNFGGQEPGSNEDIKKFCTSRFNVTFPMASKVSVKGNDIDPFFKWLTNKSENGVLDANISWNFNKFLLDEDGKLIQHFSSNVEPMSESITKYLQ